MNRVLIISILFLLCIPITPTDSGARPNYLTDFATRYPSTSLLNDFGCNICHKDRENYDCRNPYGEDVSSASVDFEAVEQLDSDGDTVSNLDEINSGTHPGRPDAFFIVYRLLGIEPSPSGDADVNCDQCQQSCDPSIYVVDAADIVRALKESDPYFPPGFMVSIKELGY